MKYAITTIAIIILSAAAPAPVRADTGGCYSPKPFCYGGQRPVCFCSIALECTWACK